MAGIPGTPNNFYVQTANRVNLVSWNQSPGATSYIIQSSLDNVTYITLATISGSPLATSYTDTTAVSGVQIWYQVAASNLSGTSSYTQPQSTVPTQTGEMSLGQIRLAAQQTADRVNSNFVTMPEWNSFINLAMFELYDLLITVYEDYYVAPPIQFVTNGSQYLYPLPDGQLTFIQANNPSQTFVPPPYYKLLGIDLAIQNVNNGYVTLNKFNFIDRNRFIYPNSSSTIYGVFNMQYRIMDNNIYFIPTPSMNQAIRVWYIPRLQELLADTDTTTTGISGWLRYVIARAAKYALDKEESDTSRLVEEIAFLKTRIEESAANRDAGQPDKISDTRSGNGGGWGDNNGGYWNGTSGGF
jgi:hypothetical protein